METKNKRYKQDIKNKIKKCIPPSFPSFPPPIFFSW